MKAIAKRFSLITAVMTMLLTMASCSSDNTANFKHLLGTVPSEVRLVAAVDFEEILESQGVELKGNKVLPSKDALNTFNNLPEDQKKELEPIFKGEAGLDLHSFVVFADTYNLYLTGLLSSVKDFEAFAAKKGYKFQKDGDISYDKEIGFCDKQFWVCIDGTVQPDRLKLFSGLSEKNSVLCLECANQLSDGEKTVNFLASVNSLLSQAGNSRSFGNDLGSKMIVSAIFKDPKYVLGCIDADMHNVEFEMSVLDSKFKPAELLLPFRTIQPADVQLLGTGTSIVAAAGVKKELIQRIEDLAQGFLNIKGLNKIDGTVALALNVKGDPLKIVIGSKNLDEINSALRSIPGFITADATSTTQGGRLVYTFPNDADGTLDITEVADDFKNAYFGLAISPSAYKNKDFALTKPLIVTISANGKGIKLKAETSVANTGNIFKEIAK